MIGHAADSARARARKKDPFDGKQVCIILAVDGRESGGQSHLR